MALNLKITYRPARKADMPQLHNLIVELATFEKEPHAVCINPKQMQQWGFQKQPYFKAWVAICQKKIIGMAVYYFAYSTWTGPAVYLEDLWVVEAFRRKGVGKALFEKVRRAGLQKKCIRMCWQVLHWNQPAIDFYTALGARMDDSWLNGRLELKPFVPIHSYSKVLL
jgi:GNAT superfamily N-acetyltransferase